MAPPAKRYPGRNRVVAREDARDYLFRQKFGTEARDPCVSPSIIHAIGLPSAHMGPQSPLPVDMAVRCRVCEGCLRHRRRLWTARAVAEITFSGRTWFGTLTVNPHERFKLKLDAMGVSHDRWATDWHSLQASDQFKLLANSLNREATLYLKRLREASSSKLRYLLVSEAHKDGFPHLHILIHEPEGSEVRKAMLEEQWRIGFSHWRLVDRNEAQAAVYVCKYLAKEARTRVRASLHYGRTRRVVARNERERETTTTSASEAEGRSSAVEEWTHNERERGGGGTNESEFQPQKGHPMDRTQCGMLTKGETQPQEKHNGLLPSSSPSRERPQTEAPRSRTLRRRGARL